MFSSLNTSSYSTEFIGNIVQFELAYQAVISTYLRKGLTKKQANHIKHLYVKKSWGQKRSAIEAGGPRRPLPREVLSVAFRK
jgi:hypothetical protein